MATFFMIDRIGGINQIRLKIKTFVPSVWLLMVNLLILRSLCVNYRKK